VGPDWLLLPSEQLERKGRRRTSPSSPSSSSSRPVFPLDSFASSLTEEEEDAEEDAEKRNSSSRVRKRVRGTHKRGTESEEAACLTKEKRPATYVVKRASPSFCPGRATMRIL